MGILRELLVLLPSLILNEEEVTVGVPVMENILVREEISVPSDSKRQDPPEKMVKMMHPIDQISIF